MKLKVVGSAEPSFLEHVHADSVQAQTEPDESTCPLCMRYVAAQSSVKDNGKKQIFEVSIATFSKEVSIAFLV